MLRIEPTAVLPDRDRIDLLLSMDVARARARVAKKLSIGDHDAAAREAEELEDIERRRLALRRHHRKHESAS